MTGYHSGIGEATARRLPAGGAEVHGLDVERSDLPLASARSMDGGAIVNVAATGGAGWQARLAEAGPLVDADGLDAAVAWCDGHVDLVAEGYRLSREAEVIWPLSEAVRRIGRGIRVNAVMPGSVSMPMLREIGAGGLETALDDVANPIARVSTSQEQARVPLFPASDAASYVDGAILPAGGGFLARKALGP